MRIFTPISRSIGATLLLVVLATAACVGPFTRTGELQTVTESVDAQGAERVNVNISPGIQDLTVRGGADGLFNGEFSFNLDQLEPRVDYRVNSGVGRLDVELKRDIINTLPMGNVISRWDLQLSNDVPLAIQMNLGLGDSQIDLSDVTLTDLDINSGAGQINVQVGRQEMERIRIRAGLGDSAVKLDGGRIDSFEFEAGAGSVSIDLSGNWDADLNAEIRGGLGSIDLAIPEDVGVRLEINSGLGDVNVRGLRVDGNIYTNDAYGSSDVTLNIRIDQGAGSVTIYD
ncbi:hypothetical protein GC175_18890 [bacterium]|nr:hypothetical protein [bacterium]